MRWTWLAGAVVLMAMLLAWWWADEWMPALTRAPDAAGVPPPPAAEAASANLPPPVVTPRGESASRAVVEPEVPSIDLETLVRDVPANTLEVLVVRDGVPLPGAMVRVLEARDGAAESLFRDRVLAEAATAADGRATFATADYATERVRLRAEHGGDFALRDVEVSSWQRTVVVPLGSASLVGVCRDELGVPPAGALILVAAVTTQQRVPVTVAPDGSFSARGLHPGRYWVTVMGLGRQWEQQMVTLRSHRETKLVFGPQPNRGRWTGRVLDGEGSLVPGRRLLRLLDEAGVELPVAPDGDGRIDALVPVGRYRILLADGLFHREPPLGELVIGADGVTVDVVLPGIRLLVLVRTLTAVTNPNELHRTVCLQVGGELQWPEGPFVAGGDLYVQWIGLAPGRVALRTLNLPRLVGEPADGVQFALAPGVAVHRLAVTLDR